MTSDVFRDPVVELYANSDWHDVTGDVRQSTGILIDRGRNGEDETTPPQTCALTFKDATGDYNPSDPAGQFHGSIGLNTPMRVALRLASDECGATVAGGWGSTDDVDGQDVYTWSTNGGAAGDYAKTGGVATHALTAAGQIRISYLADVDLGDVDLSCTVTVPTSDVTGSTLASGIGAANLLVHGQGAAASYYLLRLVIQTDESVTLDFWTHTGASITDGSVTVPGLTHTAAQSLRVRMQVEGWTLRAKVWPSTDPEPFGWHLTFTDEDVSGATTAIRGIPGWVGIRSSLLSTNTNAPITISYDDIELRSPRFFGEVPSWPRVLNPAGTLTWVPVRAAGVKRRLSQGASPLKSAPRRYYVRSPVDRPDGLVHYWPLEDGPGSTTSAPLVGPTGGFYRAYVADAAANPGRIWGSGDLAPWLSPVAATYGLGSGTAIKADTPVPSIFIGITGWMFEFARRGSHSQGLTEVGLYARVAGAADSRQLRVVFDADNREVEVSFQGGAASVTSLPSVFDGTAHHIRLTAEQTGGGLVTWSLVVDDVSKASATVAGTLLRLSWWELVDNVKERSDGLSVGHVAIYNQVTTPAGFSGYDAMTGFTGERAGARLLRLCDEEDIEFGWVGGIDPDGDLDTPAMGPQRAAPLLELLAECERADLGVLYEPRGGPGIHYRTRRSFESQAPAVTLDYATQEIGIPWAPVPGDDRHVRNDVTVRQAYGGEYRHEVTDGRLSVSAPEDGGAGRYDHQASISAASLNEARGVAEWLAHLGTVAEDRYPAVVVDLHGHALRANAAKQFALLDLDIGHRLVVEGAPSADDVTQLAIGYSERITEYEHTLTVVGVPESPYHVITLDTDSLGSDSTTLAAGVSTTDTSLFVTSGDTWTTDATDWPVSLVVGGEVVEATSIAAKGVTFVSSGTTSEGSNAPRTPGLPVGAQQGDLLLIAAAIRNSPDGQPVAPDGYTTLLDAVNLKLFGKIHSGSEVAPTVNFTGGVIGASNQAHMAAFRGVSPEVLAAAHQLNASAQNIAYPGLTVPSNRAVVLYLGWKQDDWTSVATIAGATEIRELSTLTGDDAGLVWDYVIQSTAANITAGSFVVTGGLSAISRGAVIALDGDVQHMTVTRSVNGVTKSHATGAEVHIADAAYLGL